VAEYDSAIALAKRLIKKKGRAVVLRSYTATAAADAAKPWKPGVNTPSNQNGFGVFLNYEQKFIDGSTILRGDQHVYLSLEGITTAPQVQGTLLRDAEIWKIIAVEPLNPGEQVVFYELQVRQ
jgi:hypothetical protein